MTNKLMNISMDNIRGTCDLKCSFSYNYGDSNCVATPLEDKNFRLLYDKTNNPPVLFNNNKYNAYDIRIILSPSHTYNNNTVDGEILICHEPLQTGNNFYIYIPIIISNEKSKASELLSRIIYATSNRSPKINENVNLNEIKNFNLNQIVPKNEYYYYFDSTNGLESIIYDRKYFIALDSNTITTLKNMIGVGTRWPILTQFPLFYNSRGPNSLLSNESEIYIDCKPVDKNEEEVQIIKDKDSEFSSPNMDFSVSPERKFQMMIVFLVFFYFILFAIIVIVLLFVFNYVLKSFMKVKVNKK